MNELQIININGDQLNYKQYMLYRFPYIVTYISEYPEKIKCYFNQIVDLIRIKRREYKISSNSTTDCNKNAEIILGSLEFDYRDNIIIGRCITKKKIILCGSENKNYSNEVIEEVYGKQTCIIGMSFHSLSYISFGLIGMGDIHMAIDTTTSSNVDKFMVQIYVGTSEEELEQIIRLRYKYEYYRICDIYKNPGECCF